MLFTIRQLLSTYFRRFAHNVKKNIIFIYFIICKIFNRVDFKGLYKADFECCYHSIWFKILEICPKKKRYLCEIGPIGEKKRTTYLTEAEVMAFDQLTTRSVLS
jgi:hypothetical protein